MVKNRLQWWLEHEGKMPASQGGFMKGKSCANNVTQLVLDVDTAFAEKKHVLAAFLDVKGAFDNVDPRAMANKLADLGCPSNLVSFTIFLTQHRFIFSEINPDCPREKFGGVTQRGVLSPLLFALTVKDITEGLSKSVEVSQFADHITLFVKTTSPDWASKLLERSIQTSSFNLSMVCLKLEPYKTVLIHFKKKNVRPGTTQIEVGDVIIASSPSGRFLAFTLDHRLTYRLHVNNVKKKYLRSMNIIKFLCGTWWGADPRTLLLIYKSYIRSKLDYGSFIYMSDNHANSLAMERIQYRAIRITLGYRTSTPVNILIAESCLTFVRDRASLLGNNFVAKNFSRGNTLTYESVKSFHQKI